MKALVFGSINIDKVFKISELPKKGETLYCNSYEIHVGGKGLNQSVALTKAGIDTYIAGAVGTDGDFIAEFLQKNDVDVSFLKKTDGFTGTTVIMVDDDGNNQMILYKGANHCLDEEYCDKVLESFDAGDLILMQYETSCVEYMLRKAHEKGLIVAFNPSPYVDKIKELPLEFVDYLILNEFEGISLSGKTAADEICTKLLKISKNIVLTLGSKGSVFYGKDGEKTFVPALKINAVDTTCAGDTFAGFFLSEILNGNAAKKAMEVSRTASAIVCQKIGAAEAIPTLDEVYKAL